MKRELKEYTNTPFRVYCGTELDKKAPTVVFLEIKVGMYHKNIMNKKDTSTVISQLKTELRLLVTEHLQDFLVDSKYFINPERIIINHRIPKGFLDIRSGKKKEINFELTLETINSTECESVHFNEIQKGLQVLAKFITTTPLFKGERKFEIERIRNGNTNTTS